MQKNFRCIKNLNIYQNFNNRKIKVKRESNRELERARERERERITSGVNLKATNT
jgi:hypothetical protein